MEIDGRKSNTYQQETGIRQGCPLSPYLFLVIMTTIFHDIYQELEDTITPYRVKNANFDEILFADDTICISENAKRLTKLLQAIQKTGRKYGMHLNMGKCEVIRISRNAEFTARDDVKFEDNTTVITKNEAKHQGCWLNDRGDPQREVKQRIATCMTILKNLTSTGEKRTHR